MAKATKSNKNDKALELAAQLAELTTPKKPEVARRPAGEKQVATKAGWTGTLAFSLLSIPVKSYTATDQDRVNFNQIHDDCRNQLNQRMYCPVCDEMVSSDHIVKGYKHNETFYTVTKEELEACEPASEELMEISSFVPAAQIDPIRIEKSYFIGPDKGGERAFALLRAGMEKTNRVAVVKFTSRGRENVAYIRPYGDNGLVMHYMYYENEVRDFNGWYNVPAAAQLNDAEVKLTAQLIDALGDDFDPTAYSDSYNANVREMLSNKVAGKQPKAIAKKAAPAPTNDLMEALKASMGLAETKGRSKQSK